MSALSLPVNSLLQKKARCVSHVKIEPPNLRLSFRDLWISNRRLMGNTEHKSRSSGSSMPSPEGHQIVVLGFYQCGKTAFIDRYMSNTFTTTLDTSIEDDYSKQITYNGMPVTVTIRDTNSNDDFAAVRDAHISKAEGVILMYDVTNQASFDKVKKFYENIVQVKETDRVPIVLVGHKCDATERVVTQTHGAELAHEHGWKFFEASAMYGTNVEAVVLETVGLIRSTRNIGATKG